MRRRLRLLGLPRLGLAPGLLALLASEVKADLTVNGIGLYDGANALIVEIQSQSTGNSGVWVYGDPQTAPNWTSPNGSPIRPFSFSRGWGFRPPPRGEGGAEGRVGGGPG